MIQVRKVIEHVYEKVLGQGSDAGSQAAASNASQEKEAEKDEDLSSVAEERVELLCSDQVMLGVPVVEFMYLVFTLGVPLVEFVYFVFTLDVPLMEFMYFVFTCTPGQSYCRQLRSLLPLMEFMYRTYTHMPGESYIGHSGLCYLWWSLCSLHLHACQVRVTVGGSGLCCLLLLHTSSAN